MTMRQVNQADGYTQMTMRQRIKEVSSVIKEVGFC
jgi:tagatose-1,6-bisphosphate aldolase non-catalytic subunit AgaZ/GatZ